MQTRIQVLCIYLLLLVISGCANKPVFTAEVLGSPTPAFATAVQQATLPLIVPTNTPLTSPTPTPVVTSSVATAPPSMEPILVLPTTATTQFMVPDFSPILYGKKYDANMFFMLLGGVQGKTWLTSQQAAAQFGGEWDYDVHSFDAGSFQVHGQAPEFSPIRRDYSILTESTLDEFGMVGVAHGWNVRQGRPQEPSADQEVYQSVVLEWLTSQGVSDPQLGQIQILRVDLEADSVDEIFISASYLDESRHTTKSGDYSVILMRRVTGNSTVVVPLAADIYRSQEVEITYPPTYSLANFIDLNRDGILEAVVDFERWEGSGAIVYEIKGRDVMEVLR
jgi:hypothetical protein